MRKRTHAGDPGTGSAIANVSVRTINGWVKALSTAGPPGFGALILGAYKDDRLVYAGRVGTGFTMKQRADLQKRLDKFSRDVAPFEILPRDPGLRDALGPSLFLWLKLASLNGRRKAPFGIPLSKDFVTIRNHSHAVEVRAPI